MNLLEKIFSKNRLSKIEKMKLDDLENEKISLETKQDSIVKKVYTLENRKNDILRKAKEMKSDLEKKSAYISYKQVDQDAKSYIAQHNMVSKNIQVLGSIAHIKRKEKLLKEANLWSILDGVNPTELETFLIEMKTKAAQHDAKAEKFVEILGDFEDEASVESEPGFDAFMKAVSTLPNGAADEEIEKTRKELDGNISKSSEKE